MSGAAGLFAQVILTGLRGLVVVSIAFLRYPQCALLRPMGLATCALFVPRALLVTARSPCVFHHA